MDSGQHRFRKVHVELVRLSTVRRHERVADFLPQTTVEAITRHKYQTRIKPGESVPPHEYPRTPTFLQVKHSHCRVVKFVFGDLKEIVTGIPLDQVLQYLDSVAVFRKPAASQHLLQFLPGARNVHHAAVVCARRKKTDKTGFSDKVTDSVSMADKKNVHIGRPVNERSFTGFGDHHRFTVLLITRDVFGQDRKPIDKIKIVAWSQDPKR